MMFFRRNGFGAASSAVFHFSFADKLWAKLFAPLSFVVQDLAKKINVYVEKFSCARK